MIRAMHPPPRRPPLWQEKLGLRLIRALAPRLQAVRAPSAPAELLPYNNLSVERRTGGKALSATWYPAYVAPRGAVLLLHPWVARGRAFFHRRGRLEALRAAGYHVLAVDFPGFGGSGRPYGFYDRAVEDALHLLDRRSAGLNLFVWGVSAGGYWAHPVLARSDQVAGAMFEDVSPHLLEWSWRAAPMGRPAYVFFRRALADAYHYLDARAHASAFDLGAVTYISGSQDELVRPEDTRELAACAGGSYSVVQGAGHLGSIKVANRAVIRTALDTLERAAQNSSTVVLRPDEIEDDSQISAVG